MDVRKAFLDLFLDADPGLDVTFHRDSDESPTTVKVTHQLSGTPDQEGQDFLQTLKTYAALRPLVDFYSEHNGLELCKTHDARHEQRRPLLEFKPAEAITAFTSRYQPNGDLDWTIDYNKTKELYRGPDPWIVFAEIDSGPACLITFLAGDNAGYVFYLTPQPEFNILRPVARGFDALLERIAKDIAAFLRLVRACVTMRGQDGHNYGYVPVQYLPKVE